VANMKVYYNSACPVCNAGIKGQRGRMESCATTVEWIDVHANPNAVAEIGVERELVRERLHVVDEKGAMHVGADAFGALWIRTPGQHVLGRIVDLPVVKTLARWLYNAFAALLYAWNRACGRW
jgi:predicted DCC family thiol-disulfide oxidoreductase YuxK